MSVISKRFLLVGLSTCLLASAGWCDSLQLKNGSVIRGKYLGGTEGEVSFQVGSTTQRYAVADIESVKFEEQTATAKPLARTEPARVESPVAAEAPVRSETNVAAEAPQLAPRPAVAPATSTRSSNAVSSSVTVPSGTAIMIRTVDAIDSDRNQVGDKFQASLEEPIVVNDNVIVSKGATVYGRLIHAAQAGSIQGRSELKLELTSIIVNGQTVPLVTGDYSVSGSSRGQSTAKRVGGGAAAGALLGAIIGGGKGAAVGAGVGAGAGTAVQVATKGEQVHVPSETLLQFTLQQDVRIPSSASTSGR